MATSSNSAPRLGFMGLPLETQHEIVRKMPRKTLLEFQTCSKHCHDLASAKIYGHLRFTLVHSDPAHHSSPSFRFSDALHTLTTSSQDYVQCIKEFSIRLDQSESEENQRKVASKYHHEEEPTRLLNTLLLLVLRDAKCLERFQLVAPVELSSQVYAALGKHESLHYVDIALDTLAVPKQGDSPYTTVHNHHPPHNPNAISVQQNASHWNTPPPLPTVISNKGSKSKRVAVGPSRKFSAFSNLKALKIRGIDDLGCTNEIAKCLTFSSTTLKTLTLSLSRHLIKKAKRPSETQADSHLIDIDEDDEDMTEPNTPLAPQITTVPVISTADIHKEKDAQSLFLAKVFGLEPNLSQDQKADKVLKANSVALKTTFDQDVHSLKAWKVNVKKLRELKSDAIIKGGPFLSLLEKCVDSYLQTSAGDRKAHSKHPKPPKPAPKTAKSVFNYFPNAAYGSNSAELDQALLYEAGLAPPGDAPVSTLAQKDTIQHKLDTMMAFHPYSASKQTGTLNSEKVYEFVPSGSSQPVLNSGHTSSGFILNANESLFSNGSIHPLAPSSAGQSGLSTSFASHNAVGSSGPAGTSAQPHPTHSGGTSTSFLHHTQPPFKPPYTFKAKLPAGIPDPGKIEYPTSSSSSSSTTDSSDSDLGEPELGTKPFEAVEQSDLDDVLNIDVDMEHPDTISSDDAEGQDEDNVFVQEDESQEGVPLADPVKDETSGPFADTEDHLFIQDESVFGNGTDLGSVKPDVGGGPSSKSLFLDGDEPLELRGGTGGIVINKRREVKVKPKPTPEDTMREYLRMKHGFAVEELNLYLIPVKASVLGRALDLSCLRRLQLLSAGPQGAFWMLMSKQQKEGTPSKLLSIHTDDVSLAFLNFVAELPILEDLFLLKRNSKEYDLTTSKKPASLDDIRTLVLRKHAKSLIRLSILNNDPLGRDQSSNTVSWELDGKCMRLLGVKAKKLKEFAFMVNSDDFHDFLRALSGFKTLVAIHLARIPSPVHVGHGSVREVRKSLMDVMEYCPDLSLRYIAMAGVIYELGRRAKPAIKPLPLPKKASITAPIWSEDSLFPPEKPDSMFEDSSASVAEGEPMVSKGKGKEKAVFEHTLSEMPEETVLEEQKSEVGMEEDSDLSEVENAIPRVIVMQHLKFADLSNGFFIFRKVCRTGRL